MRQGADVAARRQAVVDLLDGLGRAHRELPRTAPITAALNKVTNVEGQRAEARKRLAAAQEILDATIAELDACARRLRSTAADRGLQSNADAVKAVEQAVAEFDRVAQELVRTRADTTRLDEDLRSRLARIAKLTDDNAQVGLVLGENQAAYAAAAEKLSVEERVSGAEYEAISHEVDDADSGLRRAISEQKSATQRQTGTHDELVRAESDLAHGRAALATALGELVAEATSFGPYAHLDLRPLLQVGAAMPWPPATQWPVPDDAADRLVIWLIASDDAPGDYQQAVRDLLPESAMTVLDAYTTATRGGRAVTDGVLKGTVDRMWTAYREFESALKAS